VTNEVSFGPFVLSVPQRRLWHAGARVALKPKEAELLVLLAERRPSTITKDEIIERLWRGAAASDAALTQTVYRLRQTLGRYTAQGDFIRTIPGVGFQFAGGSPIETRSGELDFERPGFSLYQQAAFHYRRHTETSVTEAIRLLERVRGEHPQYVPALVLLAKAYTEAGIRLFRNAQDAYWHACRALTTVIEREPAYAEAHASLSTLLLFFNGYSERARGAAERALLLEPNASHARKAAFWERLACADFEAALTQADLAVRSGPASSQSISLLGTGLYMAGRFDDAHRCFETARRLDPLHTISLYYEASAFVVTGEHERAEKLLALIGGADLRARVLALRGCIATARGDSSESARAIAALTGANAPSNLSLAAVYAARGDFATAAHMLERAARSREPGLFLSVVDPLYAPLRISQAEAFATIERRGSLLCDRCGTEIRTREAQPQSEIFLCGACYAL